MCALFILLQFLYGGRTALSLLFHTLFIDITSYVYGKVFFVILQVIFACL